MKTKLLSAITLTLILAIGFTSLAVAADPIANVEFTTDLPPGCSVHVDVFSYTNPANQSGQTAGGSTPLILPTYPSTSVLFSYSPNVICNSNTYYFISVFPSNPVTSGTAGSAPTIVTGHYVIPDTTAPTITDNADMTVEGNTTGGANVIYTAPTATDIVDPNPSVSCSPTSGSFFALGGPTTVICTATDASNNSNSSSFDVTVVDTTAPTLVGMPANITVEVNTGGAIVTYTTPTATDIVDPNPSVSCTPASGSFFTIGVTAVNCTAKDTNNNTNTASFNVTVIMDTTPPELTLPSDITAPAVNASGAPVTFTASAYDLIDGPVAVTCSHTSGSIFPIGTTTVNCSATDSKGNKASGNFTISVQYPTGECKGVTSHQILQPINTDGSSVFKAGSTVPAKFRVCGTDGVPITTAGVIESFNLIQIVSNSTLSDINEEVDSTTPDTEFRTGNGQWIFNISTKDLTADNTYVYLITLNDGSTIQFQYTLK